MDTRNTTAQRIHTALTTTAIFALGVTAASAHPGHALAAEPVSHFVTSPYHLITLTIAGAGMLLGAKFVQRLATRRALQVTGIAALAIAAVTAATQL
jgi:hypothetical protein